MNGFELNKTPIPISAGSSVVTPTPVSVSSIVQSPSTRRSEFTNEIDRLYELRRNNLDDCILCTSKTKLSIAKAIFQNNSCKNTCSFGNNQPWSSKDEQPRGPVDYGDKSGLDPAGDTYFPRYTYVAPEIGWYEGPCKFDLSDPEFRAGSHFQMSITDHDTLEVLVSVNNLRISRHYHFGPLGDTFLVPLPQHSDYYPKAGDHISLIITGPCGTCCEPGWLKRPIWFGTGHYSHDPSTTGRVSLIFSSCKDCQPQP